MIALISNILKKISALFAAPAKCPEPTEKRNIIMGVEMFVSGGLERTVLDMAIALKKHDIKTTIFVAKNEGAIAKIARESGITVECFNGNNKRYEKQLISSRPDAYIIHHCYTGVAAVKRAGISIVEVLHNLYHWQKKNDTCALLRKKHIESIVSVSEAVTKFSINNLGIPEKKIKTISNGLSTTGLFRPTPIMRKKIRMELFEKEFVFIHIGNFFWAKRHSLMLYAFSKFVKMYPHSKLKFIGGEGEEKCLDLVKKLAEKLGLKEKVIFAGHLDRWQLSQECARSHVALLPSAIEGFSIALLEYLYLGLPVIATDAGAAKEVFENASVGKLLPPPLSLPPKDKEMREKNEISLSPTDSKEADELLAAMQDAKENYSQWFAYGENGAQHVKSFLIDETAAKYAALLKTIFPKDKP